jgi:hypothetical protein
MTTDYRALCAEPAGWIERATRHYIRDPDVLIRARAALATPDLVETRSSLGDPPQLIPVSERLPEDQP